jgi:hypothetical protein
MYNCIVVFALGDHGSTKNPLSHSLTQQKTHSYGKYFSLYLARRTVGRDFISHQAK